MQFLFTDHTLDTDRRELRRAGESIDVEPQVLDVLIYLVENRERVVSKDDLIASVWEGRIVSDATLSSRIYAARKALGDTGQDQKLIRTFARKGHRFIGAVSTPPKDDEPAATATGPPRMNTASGRARAALSDRPAIAVLPFVNMSGDPEQEYFSDGICEDLITAFSKLRWFLVIARNSSFAYKGKFVNIKQVAEELGVGYVIEGSVRKSGERVRITAQLNDVATGSHIWAERYDRRLADVFAVQDEITAAIVASIEPQLYAAEHFHCRRNAPESLDAWGLVMRALSHFWRLTPQDNVVTQALLEKAITIDPNYGQALGVLAASHVMSAYMGWTDGATAVPIAERAALAAIRADSDDPWARHALGCVHLILRRFDDALAELELTLSLNPNFALAQSIYGLILSFYGRWEDAHAVVIRALRLSPRDPLSALYNGIAAYAQFVGRNYEEAMRLAGAAFDFAAITSAATASSAPPPLWPDGAISLLSRCMKCDAPNPISRSLGSRPACRSNATPTGSTFWRRSAAPA